MNAFVALRLACVAAALVAAAVSAQPTDKLYMPAGVGKIWSGKPSTTYKWGSDVSKVRNATGVHPGTGGAIERDADGWVRCLHVVDPSFLTWTPCSPMLPTSPQIQFFFI